MVTVIILMAVGAAFLVLALNRQSDAGGAWSYADLQALAHGEERAQ